LNKPGRHVEQLSGPEGSKPADRAEPEEFLIADRRAGLTLADMVEQKLRALLHGAPLRSGHLRLDLHRTHECTKRMIEPALAQKRDEASARRATYQARGESSMYAISIEQPHAATILTGPPPFHYRSWRTDHRGTLLIHARKPKTPKGLVTSARGMACNALVGVVELVDWIESGHPGADPDEVEYLWMLAKPRVFVCPLPYTGRQGLFMVSDEVVAAALEEAGAPAPSGRRGHGEN
jgi:hypothetical protein